MFILLKRTSSSLFDLHFSKQNSDSYLHFRPLISLDYILVTKSTYEHETYILTVARNQTRKKYMQHLFLTAIGVFIVYRVNYFYLYHLIPEGDTIKYNSACYSVFSLHLSQFFVLFFLFFIPHALQMTFASCRNFKTARKYKLKLNGLKP